MAKTCKYKKQYQYVSYDNGLTWRSTGEIRRGSLIEENSQECGFIPVTLYKWEVVDGEYMCGDCGYKPDSTI